MLPKELKHFYEKSEKVAKSSKRKSSVKPNLVDKKTRKNVDIEKLVDDVIFFLFTYLKYQIKFSYSEL